MPSNWDKATRRPHTKSRNGCVRCKRQRRKCDEGSPACVRCATLNVDCQYLKPARIDLKSPCRQDISTTGDLNTAVRKATHNRDSPSSCSTLSQSCSSSATSLQVDLSTPPCSSPSDRGQQDDISPDSSIPLNAGDLELLTHYLTHTSQTIPYDKTDLYALHIGIPNLAFRSKPLMSSVLALAAVCQCCDFLATTETPDNLALSRIKSLLELAEKHHRTSLHQIQEAIGTERYDTVLANATLMTLYGSAVHCVRIRLVKLLELSGKEASVPNVFVPAHSQWIRLIRAVHCAFIGLRTDLNIEGIDNSDNLPNRQTLDGELDVDAAIGEVKCSQDGPTETTLRLFLPIVTATIGGAIEKLRARVWRTRESSSATTGEMQACTGALEILASIAEESVSGVDKNKSTVCSQDHSHDGSIGRLSLVAPWLRVYTARVTSNSDLGIGASGSSTSRPLRRKITSFINRVDAQFLSLVQERLERTEYSELDTPEPGDEGENAAVWCAMDIFAHWLVLMCLLDGVWWIGGIGMWELGRLVSYIEWPHSGEEDGQTKETWWPASMYKIRMELAKHRV